MALDFNKTQSKAMVDNVMKKVDDTELDNKKRDIPLDLIDLNPDNEEIFGYEDIEHLAARISENGFYGAIDVYAKKDGRYEISSGHRRYLACKSLGWKTIPCIISADVNDVDKAKHLIEGNIHNRVMTPYKTAKALEYYDIHVISLNKKELRGTGFDRQKVLAEVFNISRTSVGRYLAILKLIPELQELTKEKNAPYNNIIGLSVLSKGDQLSVYHDLEKIAGEDGINSLSKTLIEQVAYKYKHKNEDDKRYTKEIKPEEKKEWVDRTEDIQDEEIVYHDDVNNNMVNYGEDEEERNEEVKIQSVNNIPEQEVKTHSDKVSSEKNELGRSNDNSFLKMSYYIKLMEDSNISFDDWTQENRASLKSRLQKIIDRL